MADKNDFMVDGKPLSSLRVVDLKQELEKRGLSKSGSKKDLADRLKAVSTTLPRLFTKFPLFKPFQLVQLVSFENIFQVSIDTE